MTPTYDSMEIVLLDRHSEHFRRGNVVAFYCDGLSSVLVKRIAACPGDTAVIRNGTLYVNGSISDVYPEEGIFSFPGLLSEVIQLESEQYLMIGDNMAESVDSRFPEVGLVMREDIYGIVCGS